MPAFVGLLRGVNVTGYHKVSMEKLRTICESLGHEKVATYIQSGNVVFRSRKKDRAKLAAEMEAAIEFEFGFRPAVVIRSLEEMEAVVANNPFAGREGINPAKLAVTFLPRDPGEEARARVRAVDVSPEELYAIGSELITYYQEGIGASKMPHKAVERAIGCQGTARNWNTVLKLREMLTGL